MAADTPATSNALALIRARRVLAAAGLDPTLPLERASSATNEVWYAGRYVVRLGPRGDGRLAREAEVVPLLPPDLGYPVVVASGSDATLDWLVTRRAPGAALSRCWPSMSDDRRESAVRQLAAKLAALHATVPSADLPPPVRLPQLLDPTATTGRRAVLPLLAALDRASNLPFVDRRVLADAADLARTTAGTLDPWPGAGLVHGDLHFENVLWDGSAVTAILDLEWCRTGPPDLDLDVLLRFCELPFLHVAADYEAVTRPLDYERVPWWLADAYPALFAVPRQLDRMRLYALAFDVRDLLVDPPRRPVREVSGQHAWHRLVRTISGTSHLDRLALAAR